MTAIRHDWTRAEIRALFELPFNDLLYRAQTVHRAHFDPNAVQVSTLLSIKTGACPEDCGYCPQSAHHETGPASARRLLDVDAVVAAARAAREAGADPLLHGRRLAQPAREGFRARARHGARGARRWAWRPASRSAC